MAARLKELGIPHKVYNPDLFLSVPVKSSLKVNGRRISFDCPRAEEVGRATTAAMASATR